MKIQKIEPVTNIDTIYLLLNQHRSFYWEFGDLTWQTWGNLTCVSGVIVVESAIMD